jgi:hypothetical protein
VDQLKLELTTKTTIRREERGEWRKNYVVLKVVNMNYQERAGQGC